MRDSRLRGRFDSRTPAEKVAEAWLRCGRQDSCGVEALGNGCGPRWSGLPGCCTRAACWHRDGRNGKANSMARRPEVECGMS